MATCLHLNAERGRGPYRSIARLLQCLKVPKNMSSFVDPNAEGIQKQEGFSCISDVLYRGLGRKV